MKLFVHNSFADCIFVLRGSALKHNGGKLEDFSLQVEVRTLSGHVFLLLSDLFFYSDLNCFWNERSSKCSQSLHADPQDSSNVF